MGTSRISGTLSDMPPYERGEDIMEKLEKKISKNMDNPSELEIIFRKNPDEFRMAFDKVFSENPNSLVLRVWKERLYFKSSKQVKKESQNNSNGIVFITVLSLFAGTIAKIVFGLMESNSLNPANLIFSVLPVLAFYFIMRNKIPPKIVLVVSALFIGSLTYINILPIDNASDSIYLANLHLPFFLWTLVGVAFIGNDITNLHKRMDYLRYNGEVVIYSTIILICGVILTGLTLSLFMVVDINITEFYITTVVVYGIAATPIVATYLNRVRNNVVDDFAPYLAKIFSPLILVTLVIYLIIVVVLQKNPYTDRNFLLIFNMMLLTVLAITIFTISERKADSSKNLNDYITASLIAVALLINGVALSAILFRLTSYGITPNRIAVLGVNLIVFVNLILITINYYGFLVGKNTIESVEKSITKYLPIYSIWTIIVTFIFPLIFNFK